MKPALFAVNRFALPVPYLGSGGFTPFPASANAGPMPRKCARIGEIPSFGTNGTIPLLQVLRRRSMGHPHRSIDTLT
jgi:hypothetical protein